MVAIAQYLTVGMEPGWLGVRPRGMTNPKHPITSADGTDITSSVQILFDTVLSSMDWGSGFLDTEEIHAVVKLAIHMGWKVPELDAHFYGPTVAVAHQYPEHYEVTATPHPYSPDGQQYRIKRR